MWSKISAMFLSSVLLVSCSGKPLDKFEGTWILDIASTMAQIKEAKLDLPESVLNELEDKLRQESPRILIKNSRIFISIESESAEITYKILASEQKCVILEISDKSTIRYCIGGATNEFLKIIPVAPSRTAIVETFKRAGSEH